MSKLDFDKIAALDQPDEFISFRMGQADNIFSLANGNALISDLDLRALGAEWAEGGFERLHSLDPP